MAHGRTIPETESKPRLVSTLRKLRMRKCRLARAKTLGHFQNPRRITGLVRTLGVSAEGRGF